MQCPKTLETKIMLLELMLYRMYTCVLLDKKTFTPVYKNLLCCIWTKAFYSQQQENVCAIWTTIIPHTLHILSM